MAINNRLFKRRIKRSLLAIVILLLAPFVQAQNAGYFIVDTESGEHRFMQRLAWSGGEYALRYEVILEREVGGRYTAHLRDSTSSLFIEVSLPPGKYRFRVIPYDILDKPGEGSEWVNIEVHRAVQPEIFEVSGRFVSSRNAGEPSGYVLTISGNNLDPGAEIFIRGSGGAQYISEEFVYDLGGNVMIFIDNGMLAPGEYEVIVKNPGGLEAGIGGVVLSRAASSLIPDDAIIWQENGHGYLVVNQDMTWDEADTYARERGGYLATITSSKEQRFVMDLLSRDGDKNNYWLGGYREGRNWHWVTGESFRYTNWLPTQPDNSHGIENKLQIVRILHSDAQQVRGRQGQWNDNSNDNFGWGSYGLIIEWDDAQVSQPNTLIPDDAIIWQENGHGYLVVDQSMTWDEANTYARERGGYLVTITSSNEQRFVMDLLSRDGDKNYYWLGGYREGTRWQWVTGESFRYTNYGNRQYSSNYFSIPTDKLSMYSIGGKWTRVIALGIHGFIIEWDAQTASAAPEPEDRNAIQPLKSTLASINIAWMPVVPLHGNYFGSDFSPAGIMANANLAFYTPLDIYIGAELAAFLSVLHVDEGIYASSPLMLSAGFNLLAMKWLPSQRTAINFRIGAYSVLRDEYYEYGMVESNTAICFNIGPSLAFRLTNKFLLEIGVNYTGNQSGGGLRPWIGIGRLGNFGRRL